MSRRSESIAPSLFPFLAVLLCTMGALVLMLILLVVGARSSAKEVAEKVEDEFQWEQDKLQSVKHNLSRKYEEAKVEIENKKLHLQNIEQHIFQLKEELEQLERTSLAAETKQSTEKESQKARDAQREALEKQLAEAKKTLETKLKDPKGDKPIFAIIPYDGPNGTHRRPIYLECNAKGLVVQPEGVVLTPADLSPPYGPGNPLDAVLRAIRAEFPSRDGSVDSNPYPLLVVRPSGIKYYMMARAAMSGWDDQFGYELIGEELELTFPPGTPNLQKKLASTIDAARQRQAALVLSMPQHYDASQLDLYGSAGGAGGVSEDVTEAFEGMSGSAAGGLGSGESGSSSRGTGGKRGGMSLLGSPAGGNGSPDRSGMGNSNEPPSLNQSLAQTPGGNKQGDPNWTFGQSAAQLGNGANGMGSSGSDSATTATNPDGSGSGQMSFFGGGSNEEVDGFSSRKSGSGTRIGGVGGPGAIGGDSPDGENFSNSLATTSKAGGGGSYSQSGSETGSSDRTGSGTSMSTSKSNGSSSSGSAGGGSSTASNPMSSSSPGNSMPAGLSSDPSQQQGEMQNVGMNVDMSKRSGETKSVAQTKGRGWAWRDGNRSQTSIVRAIWLQCYKDRWIIRPDKGSNTSAKTIKLEGSPVQRAERLAAVVHQRVESWGVALAGGHWAPVIHVEVASDAEDQYKQLQKLMEGSGIELIRKGTIATQVFR